MLAITGDDHRRDRRVRRDDDHGLSAWWFGSTAVRESRPREKKPAAMKKTRFIEEQMVTISGKPTRSRTRTSPKPHGIIAQTIDGWLKALAPGSRRQAAAATRARERPGEEGGRRSGRGARRPEGDTPKQFVGARVRPLLSSTPVNLGKWRRRIVQREVSRSASLTPIVSKPSRRQGRHRGLARHDNKVRSHSRHEYLTAQVFKAACTACLTTLRSPAATLAPVMKRKYHASNRTG